MPVLPIDIGASAAKAREGYTGDELQSAISNTLAIRSPQYVPLPGLNLHLCGQLLHLVEYQRHPKSYDISIS